MSIEVQQLALEFCMAYEAMRERHGQRAALMHPIVQAARRAYRQAADMQKASLNQERATAWTSEERYRSPSTSLQPRQGLSCSGPM